MNFTNWQTTRADLSGTAQAGDAFDPMAGKLLPVDLSHNFSMQVAAGTLGGDDYAPSLVRRLVRKG